jgi:DNA polymerase-1
VPETERPAATPPLSLVRSAEELAAVLPALIAAGTLGVDCETTGLDPLADRLRLIQLATPERVVVVDCFSVDPAPLAEVFARTTLAGHNLAFDLRFLMGSGLPVPNGERLFDTMLASQVLHSGQPEPRGTHTLAAVVERTLGRTLDKTLQVSDWSGTLSEAQLAYAADDAAVLLPLVERQRAALRAADLERTAAIEMRALPALVWLAQSGAPFDGARWTALADGALAEQQRLEAELTRLSGTADMFGYSSVNWDSTDQVAKLLRRRGHQVTSTNEHVLQRLVADEPIAVLLLQYREASRKTSAYGADFLRHVHPATGRIHAGYQQIGASSGRMACGNPNLQNIPRDAAYRACFRPGQGRCLVKADYSQIELRIVAQVSSDAALLGAYREDADVHARTAAALMSVPEAQVTKAQRQLAKACDFGLLYGMGAPRLREYAASAYGVTLTEEEAQTFRERFFQTYPGLRRWHRGQPDRPVATRTLAGRRRLNVQNFVDKLNLPIQGTGADILKLALARLWEDRAAQPSAMPVLCVHDEIVLECDAREAEAVAVWLKRQMEAAGEELLPAVPVVADVTIAADWSGAPLTVASPR